MISLSPGCSEPTRLRRSCRESSGRGYRAIEDEIAGVLIYLVRLVDRLNVDLAEAVDHKLESNRPRYTVERSHGSAAKIESRGVPISVPPASAIGVR
jgi:hypothetical protein